jgi:nitrite reductase/ring-hydroxylating ferredoxin subunit
MGIFSRILGICKTKPPSHAESWHMSDGRLEIDLTKTPELANKGGAIRLEGRGLPVRILVVHGEDGAFHAIENRCTHAGRRIDPLAGQSRLECCSVGKSTWEYDGTLVSGSAKKPIRVLSVSEETGRLAIDVSGQG